MLLNKKQDLKNKRDDKAEKMTGFASLNEITRQWTMLLCFRARISPGLLVHFRRITSQRSMLFWAKLSVLVYRRRLVSLYILELSVFQLKSYSSIKLGKPASLLDFLKNHSPNSRCSWNPEIQKCLTIVWEIQ